MIQPSAPPLVLEAPDAPEPRTAGYELGLNPDAEPVWPSHYLRHEVAAFCAGFATARVHLAHRKRLAREAEARTNRTLRRTA